MRLIILTRHAESVLNVAHRINGDPSRSVALTERGIGQAERLGSQLAHVRIDRCIHTRFDRTRETASLVLGKRNVPLEVEPLLDDLNVGELEDVTVEEFRAWKRQHRRDESFPGGESLVDAARRYASGLASLLERRGNLLVVCHELPIRYALNAAAASSELDQPFGKIRNATPYLFDDEALDLAAARIMTLASAV